MVERRFCTPEVRSSILLGSTLVETVSQDAFFTLLGYESWIVLCKFARDFVRRAYLHLIKNKCSVPFGRETKLLLSHPFILEAVSHGYSTNHCAFEGSQEDFRTRQKPSVGGTTRADLSVARSATVQQQRATSVPQNETSA